MTPLNEHELIADARRKRFLEEIADHLEDAGDPARVGKDATLIEHFNMYAQPRHRTRLFIVFAVSSATLIIPMWMFTLIHNGGPNLPWQGILGIPSVGILAPVILPLIILSETFGIPWNLDPLAGEVGVCVLASMFWTTVTYMALFSPPKWLASKK